MGAQLVLEAIGYSNTADISYAARCLLTWMAVRALDDSSATPERPARLSYMSRSQLAVGIGRFMPDREPCSDAPIDERRQWDADDRAVSRALEALKTNGAIVEVERARNGWTATYLIDLGRRSTSPFTTKNVTLRPPRDPTASDTDRHPSSDTDRHPSGRSASPKADAHRRPKENQNQPEKYEDEITYRGTSPAPVDNPN